MQEYESLGWMNGHEMQYILPEGVKVLGREGHKAYNDRCAPYIRRIYEDIASNEWWIADNHTFDVMVRDKSGKLHRLSDGLPGCQKRHIYRIPYYIQSQFRGYTDCPPERNPELRYSR